MTLTQERPAQAPATQASEHARWRALLERRWRERLQQLTVLCVAFHESGGLDGQVQPSVRQLMRQAVSARQALAETDEALGRLTRGTFGSCEDCSAEIPALSLLRVPEMRYCERCAAF